MIEKSSLSATGNPESVIDITFLQTWREIDHKLSTHQHKKYEFDYGGKGQA
jgi:hypothetical protein